MNPHVFHDRISWYDAQADGNSLPKPMMTQSKDAYMLEMS